MGWIIVIMGFLLIGIGVWLFIYAASDPDYEFEEKLGKEYSDEEMSRDILEMMKELGGDEEG